MCQTKFLSLSPPARVFCIFFIFFFKPVIYSGRRFEATTSAGYLLQTLGQALPRDRAISILNVIPQKYTAAWYIDNGNSVIKPGEIGADQFWGRLYFNRIDAAAAIARRACDVFDAGDFLKFKRFFILFLPYICVALIARRAVTFEYIIGSLFLSLASAFDPLLSRFMSYLDVFSPDSSANKMWFNSDV